MFVWINRIGCIRRAQVLMHCCFLPINQAIMEALKFRFQQTGKQAFCNDPSLIPIDELDRLHRDVEAYAEKCLIYQRSGQSVEQMEIHLTM